MANDVAHNNWEPSNQTATSLARTTSNHTNRYTKLSLSLNGCDHFGTLELNFHGKDSIISSGTSRVSVVITAFCTTRFVFPAFCADRRARTRSRALAPRSVRTVGVVAHYGFRTVCEWFPVLRHVPERFPLQFPKDFRCFPRSFRRCAVLYNPFCVPCFLCGQARAHARARTCTARCSYCWGRCPLWFPNGLRMVPEVSPSVPDKFPKGVRV